MLPDDPDALARLIYLVVLLAGLLGFFLAGRRGRLGATLRQLLVWALIFAMAIIAYGFRDTLRRELFPGASVQVAEGAIELRRARDGHFHATLEVNGAPVHFLVDTGASDLVLARDDAERVGLDPSGLNFAGRAITANGAVATAAVRLERVAFGGVADRDVPASVTSGGLRTSLLGMTYLDRFSRIEIVGDRMILTR